MIVLRVNTDSKLFLCYEYPKEKKKEKMKKTYTREKVIEG